MVIVRFAGLVASALALLLVPAASPARTALPQRIVSLSPTATEDLFAIGAGKQVVAVDDQSNYPPSAPKTRLSGYTPNAEAIAAYDPDLVIVQFDANHVEEALGKLHIRVLEQPSATSLTGAYSELTQLGRVSGHGAAAARVVSRMRVEIANIVAHVPRPKPRLTVYHELEPDLYSATSKTFIGQVYSLLGLADIADAADKTGSGYPKLSAEYVVGADPDLIVLADTICCAQTVAKLRARPGWSTIDAVRKGGVVAVSDDIASRWGPRIVDFVRTVASTVRTISAR